jgi:hypothetical protein
MHIPGSASVAIYYINGWLGLKLCKGNVQPADYH